MSDGQKDEAKQGRPLPDSEEARHKEIPEHLEREKGRGDDERRPSQPKGEYVAPDGAPYAAHRERSQSNVEDPDR